MAALLVSCVKEELKNTTPDTVYMTIVAGANDETRTVLGNYGAVTWNAAGENIMVYEKAGDTISQKKSGEGKTTDGGSTMSFPVNLSVTTADSYDYYAFYPYDANIEKPTDFKKTKIELNGTQTPTETSFGQNVDILVAKPHTGLAVQPEELTMQFARIVSVGKMTIKNLNSTENISKITFTAPGKVLAGRSYVDLTSATVTEYGYSNALDNVVLDYTGKTIAANGMTAYFTCWPFELAAGDKFTVKAETETQAFTKEVTVPEGKTLEFKTGRASAFSVDFTGIEAEQTADDGGIHIVFLTSTNDNTTAMTKSTAINQVVEEKSVDYIASWGTCTKAFHKSKSGLKLGASVPGTIEFNLADAVKDNITLIKLISAKYGSDTGTLTLSVDGKDLKTGITPGVDYSHTFETPTTVSTLKISTSEKRAYISEIIIITEEDTRTSLETPTNIKVSDAKLVSWDVVDGAATYTLTIGGTEYSSDTNSYDASALEDDYYDVTLVAVPSVSDEKTLKKSAAAVLSGAKFGTPTLSAPELKEGAIDENMISVTWSVDARATAGYNCELYNGETKVGESKTVSTGSVSFTGLDGGVTYTVKVNAIATAGEKPYAASETSSIDLTTKAAYHVSDVTAAGTYTIKGLTVYAVPNTSNAIVGDATGYILYYKSGHGLKVGDRFDVSGSVKSYNGIWEFDQATISNKVAGEAPVYGTAVEATVDFMATYKDASKVEYIHAKGAQKGREITVAGSTVPLYLSADNAATDGKDVEVYGFVYGWYAKNSNISFVATSIEENPDAPKLSVDPAGKTWASNETDAAVFNVSVANGEWSVTPETLDWATIAIDKAANTITVTPNGENTTDAAYEAALTVAHSADPSLTQTITLKQNAAGGASETIEEIYNFSRFTQANDVTLSANNFTIKLSKNNGQIAPQWNTNSSEARLYVKGSICISSSTMKIVKIEFTYNVNANSSDKVPTIDSVKGASIDGTWDSSSKTWSDGVGDNSVTLSTSGTAGNIGFKSVKVTLSK